MIAVFLRDREKEKEKVKKRKKSGEWMIGFRLFFILLQINLTIVDDHDLAFYSSETRTSTFSSFPCFYSSVFCPSGT
jgi:hypothetical protein